MSGSCHLDRASNVEIGVECQIFVIVIFFNCSQVLQFGAHSRYYKGALTQKRSYLVICTTFRFDFHVSWKNKNKHSTLNSSFDALSQWHEPDISITSLQSHTFAHFSTNNFKAWIISMRWSGVENFFTRFRRISTIWKLSLFYENWQLQKFDPILQCDMTENELDET